MSRPDIEAIKDAEFSGELYLTDEQVMALVAHIDTLEAALRREIGRCNEPTPPGWRWCCRAPKDYKCPAHRAALALLDGSE